LLNCVVVWLVFLACSILLQDDWVALVAALIFALHPIHTEVVAQIAAVTELELAVFYLAAFILFVRLDSPLNKEAIRTRILMCGCFVLALLSKEQALTLAAVATIYEHFYRSDRQSTTWQTKVERYGGLWVIAGVYLLFRAIVLGALAPVRQHPDVTWPQAFLSALALVGQYVAKLFWPYPLLAFYVFRKSSSLGDPRVVAAIGVAALAIVLFVYLRKRAPIYSFAVIWIALTLAPVLNARWMATNVFTERYLYLPSVGFCMLLAGCLVFLFRCSAGIGVLRWTLTLAAVVIVVLATSVILARNRDWRDDFTLYSRTLQIEPHASNARTDLGALEWNQHREEEAVREWRLALADNPDNPITLANLGMAMLQMKHYREAEGYLQQAIALRPRYAQPHVYLGSVYLAEGNTARAEAEFRSAVEIYPLSTAARNALGKLYFDAGNLSEAKIQYQASAESLPNADALDALGDIYLREGAPQKSEQAWRQALQLSPFDTHAHASLGGLYLASGRQAEAEKEYRSVLLLDPGDAQALRAMRQLRPNEFPAARP
jgi:tetratricopeptide (TPR) repeat protein